MLELEIPDSLEYPSTPNELPSAVYTYTCQQIHIHAHKSFHAVCLAICAVAEVFNKWVTQIMGDISLGKIWNGERYAKIAQT